MPFLKANLLFKANLLLKAGFLLEEERNSLKEHQCATALFHQIDINRTTKDDSALHKFHINLFD